MNGRPGDKCAGDTERVTERKQLAFSLRVAGYSYRKIGVKIGVSYQQALNDVREVLKTVQESTFKDALEHIELELSRLDAVLEAMEAGMAEGDPGAASVYLKACESRRKLMGLDAAQKTELSGPNGGPIQIEGRTFDELRALPDDELLRIHSESLGLQSTGRLRLETTAGDGGL